MAKRAKYAKRAQNRSKKTLKKEKNKEECREIKGHRGALTTLLIKLSGVRVPDASLIKNRLKACKIKALSDFYYGKK